MTRYKKLGLATALLSATLTATLVPAPAFAAPHTRTIIAQTGEIADQQVTAKLNDGSTLELKWVIGGVVLSINREQGEDISSSIQSITNNEAASLRDAILNADQCPVELTFVQDQLVQAKPVCK